MHNSALFVDFLLVLSLASALPVPQAPSNPINAILAALVNLPIIGQAVNGISDALTTFEQDLAVATDTQTTENDPEGASSASCAPMSVVFARGTTEPGNVGLVTGPPFFDALEAMLGTGQVAVQGVDYSASIEGFLEGGDKQGSQVMASLISSTLANCPNTKLVMSGYSQGGQLVHNAAALLPAATMAKVSSVVIFGDPDDGEGVAGVSSAQTKVICHAGDNICQHGDLILLPHLTYSENAQEAATFAVAAAGLGIGGSTNI